MTESGSRRGAANLAPILMIVSFLAMAGLLVWLGRTAEGTQPVAMDEGMGTDSVESAALLVTAQQLRDGPGGFVGLAVRLEEVAVSSGLGARAFLVELGSQGQSSPFLVMMDSTLVAEGHTVPRSSTNVTITGTIREINDSIVNAWVDGGLVPASERVVVEFVSHWLDAARLREEGATQGGEPVGDSP
jgi:hypothetical protein